MASGDGVHHLSVFAFARLPLLVYLGSCLDDTIATDIYQRHRLNEAWTLWVPETRCAGVELGFCRSSRAGMIAGGDCVRGI
jgi:hypothetical protein